MKLEMIRTSKIPWLPLAKSLVPPALWHFLYKQFVVKDIEMRDQYRPFFSPWLHPDFISEYEKVKPYTLVSLESCWTLTNSLEQALQVDGDVVEAGVFQGGTALLLKNVMKKHDPKQMFLFDSFEGMIKTDKNKDRHSTGDFSDLSLESVRKTVGSEPFVHYHKGWIPETFKGLENNKFCFAHIDLDLYDSIMDCCAFIYPRISRGGIIVFDDYGYASCPGARKAVTEFFAEKPERPLALQTGQAIVYKL